jgi:hypothetical protein
MCAFSLQMRLFRPWEGPEEFVAFRRVLPGLCQPIVNQKPDSGDRAAQDRMLV